MLNVIIEMVEIGMETIILKKTMTHLPRVGDIIRLGYDDFWRIKEVYWCFDNPDTNEVHIRIDTRRAYELT